MFKFAGRMERKRFLWASSLRIGLFLASVVGFPFFLMVLASATYCRGVGGACGAVGLLGAMVFKPLAFVLLVFSFAGISMRRTRDAGVPGWIGLFVPILFAADYTALVYTGAPWSFAFSSGLLRTPVPYYAFFAIACTAILCTLPSRGRSPDSRNPFGRVGLLAFGLGLFVAAYFAFGLGLFVAALAVIYDFPQAAPFIVAISSLFATVAKIAPYGLASLVAALAWIAWRERGHLAAAGSADRS
jgi:uncharacterized membrane protein YhaH (DUF805 family)